MVPRRRRRQDGYALLVILLAVSVLVITLAQALPSWKTEIQREHEARMIDHAREYRTAIQRYFHSYGRYPPSMDALVHKDAKGIRYLRQAWPDNLSQSADASSSDSGAAGAGWEILHYGQAVTAEIVDQPPQAAMSQSGSSIDGPNLSGGSGTSAGGGGMTMAGGMQPSGGANPGAFGAGVGQGLAPGLAAAPGTGLSPGASGGPGTGLTSGPGAGIGGGPIIGVASSNKKPAVHEFNGFDIPNKWQFVYNYASDRTLRAGGAGSTPGLPTRIGPGQGVTPNVGGITIPH
ncbi:MAG: type IV pilin protein [Terriglobales bacterium]